MSRLQELYEKYKDQEMVILGFNCADDKQIALDFIRENSATFPNILDSSYATRKLVFDGYNNRSQEVPLSYIIDREGKVADAWFGYEKDHKRALMALEKLGVKLESQ